MAARRDSETGGLHVYSDEHRRFSRGFGPPAPTRTQLRGGDGSSVTFVSCATDEMIGCGDVHVERLPDAGWRLAAIALLTMGSRHPIQKVRQESEGHLGQWRSFCENDDAFYGLVFYGQVLG